MKEGLFSVLKKRFPDKKEKQLYAWIMCGQVRYGGEILKDPAVKVQPALDVEFLFSSYVSRGGDKLKGLINLWALDFNGKIVLDGGSSTGGFTDCVLQQGAQKVYSVDVGYNQLDYRLRRDTRVEVMERTNIMSLKHLDPEPQLAVADLSFRSITGAAGHMISMLTEKRLYALIKPQFEIEKTDSFTGIVSDPSDWKRILLEVRLQLNREGMGVLRSTWSTVKGRKGNQEFFFEIAPAEQCPTAENQETNILEMLKGVPR